MKAPEILSWQCGMTSRSPISLSEVGGDATELGKESQFEGSGPTGDNWQVSTCAYLVLFLFVLTLVAYFLI